MAEPDGLYRIEDGDDDGGGAPVLVHAFTGFVDAGQAGEVAVAHLLETLEHRVVATFDADQLVDYRSRRPPMLFDADHWVSVEAPELVLREVRDVDGTRFLLLSGPEPDVQWERFSRAVTELVERYGVRLTVGLGSIPMAVPHTRPATLTAHATRPELVAGHEKWFGVVQVPGSIGNLLELRLGQAGHDAVGLAAHVPHYLARIEWPQAAVSLLEEVARTGGLSLPLDELRAASTKALREVDEQVARSEESREVVAALEQRFDATVTAGGRRSLLPGTAELPSGDEIAAELEQFLAEQDGGPAAG